MTATLTAPTRVTESTKMVIVRVTGRREELVSWATGDRWALDVMTLAAAQDPDVSAEWFWRPARTGEVEMLNRKRAGKKLPGWRSNVK